MGMSDKLWDAITTVIKMNDKIERMAGAMVVQQQKIENLTERVIRLETALEIALSHSAKVPAKAPSTRRVTAKEKGETLKL